MSPVNYYQLLQVPVSASVEEIKAAYNKRLDEFRQGIYSGNHPDADILDNLRNAYSTLITPDARAAYDASLDAVAPPQVSENPSKEISQQSVREGFRFTGDGAEYFRIWIVNFLLSVLTLGIYSAWAKVRREQYFHRNLLLDGSGFDYHAQPKAILKGRAIALLLLMAVSATKSIGPGAYLIALAVFSLAVPWLAIRTFRFRAINTSYRGLRFGFEARYGEAFKVIIGYGLLALLTLGLAFPLFYRQLRKFLIDHARFGTSSFSSSLRIATIYRIFLMPALIALAVGVVLIVVSGLIVTGGANPGEKVLVGGLFVITPVAFYIFVLAYLAVSTLNAVWSSTALGEHRFESEMPIGGYLKLSVINWLGIVLTLGLFIPWARVRMARFRASHLSLVVQGDLEHFVAGEVARSSAIGDETAEMFDLDIAL